MKFFVPLTIALGVASAVKLDTRQSNQQLNDILRLLTGQIQAGNGRNVNYNDILRQLQGIGGNQDINELLRQLQLAGQVQGVGNQDLNEILRQLQDADRRQRGDDRNDRDREGKGKGKGNDNNREQQQINDLVRQLQGLLGNQVNVADLLRGVNGGQQLNLDQEILNQFLRQQNVVIPGVDLQRLNLNDINQVVQGIDIMLAQLCLNTFFDQNALRGIAQNNLVANQMFLQLFQLIQLQQLGFLNNNDILGLLVGNNIFGAGGFSLTQLKRSVAMIKKNAKRHQLRRSVHKRQQQVDCAAVLAGIDLATITAPTPTATSDAAATETNTETETTTEATAEATATDAAEESSTSSAAAARRTVA